MKRHLQFLVEVSLLAPLNVILNTFNKMTEMMPFVNLIHMITCYMLDTSVNLFSSQESVISCKACCMKRSHFGHLTFSQKQKLKPFSPGSQVSFQPLSLQLSPYPHLHLHLHKQHTWGEALHLGSPLSHPWPLTFRCLLDLFSSSPSPVGALRHEWCPVIEEYRKVAFVDEKMLFFPPLCRCLCHADWL